MSNIKTVALLGALTGIFLFIGGMAGGRQGMLLALVFAGLMNFVAYWFSDKIVLKAYRASPLAESEAPRIHAMVREMCLQAQVPMPAIYVFEQDSPNAFATGRDPEKAVIALSRGIMQLMGEAELKGVIAHELTHVVNRDTLLQPSPPRWPGPSCSWPTRRAGSGYLPAGATTTIAAASWA